MAFPAEIVIPPVGILFVLSGLIVNLIQALVYVLIRPLSKNIYSRINKVVAELLWLELIWLVDWWAGVKVELYADSQTFNMLGKENALVICNHKSDIDWLVGWVIAQRAGCLGSALAIMTKAAKFLPIIGWSMWFSGCIFLDRSWAKDESTLKSGFKGLADFPIPFWLALFVEGTRFTRAKLLAAQRYASSQGLPVPRNVLIPRTKGFVSAVTHMRPYVPAIYDCTVAVPRNQPAPTMLRIVRGKSFVVKLQIKRHPMQELPETEDGIAQWCKDVFVTKERIKSCDMINFGFPIRIRWLTKDAFLEKFHAEDLFGTEELQDIGRPLRSMLVVLSWSCLLVFGVVKFFQLLSTWQGIVIVLATLVLVTLVMQILIHSSPEALQQDPAREELLPE